MSIHLYSLVHWEDPLDMTQGCSPTLGVSFSTKEGTLLYRAGTTYLGKELWKSCYLVLRYARQRERGQKLGFVFCMCAMNGFYEVFNVSVIINLTHSKSSSFPFSKSFKLTV